MDMINDGLTNNKKVPISASSHSKTEVLARLRMLEVISVTSNKQVRISEVMLLCQSNISFLMHGIFEAYKVPPVLSSHTLLLLSVQLFS